MTPEDKKDINALFLGLVSLLESHQRQIDELLERVLSIEDAVQKTVKGLPQKQEEAASLISNATQYLLADKVDLYAELRQVIERLCLRNDCPD